MTRDFADLPAEVRHVVAELAAGPSLLADIDPAWVTAAFDHGLIQAEVGHFSGYTRYSLLPQPVVTR